MSTDSSNKDTVDINLHRKVLYIIIISLTDSHSLNIEEKNSNNMHKNIVTQFAEIQSPK